uniref:ATP synthase peripheral stalk subunit OSCP, mitochondrial n=1 Tax=Syphacia muris TaxID=451379 RepID=A0A0N5AUL2_9BILA
MATMMLKRSLSLSAIARNVIRPPIHVHGVEGRYASALYSASYKQNNLDTVERDLLHLKKIFDESTKFREFVLNPMMNASVKKSGLLAVLDQSHVCKEVKNFIVLLLDNRRLTKFSDVLDCFETIMRAHRNEVFIRITSAEPLSRKHKDSLDEVLKKFVKPTQKVHIEMAVNPKIMGGLILNIGDKYVDLSIASRMKAMEQVVKSELQ